MLGLTEAQCLQHALFSVWPSLACDSFTCQWLERVDSLVNGMPLQDGTGFRFNRSFRGIQIRELRDLRFIEIEVHQGVDTDASVFLRMLSCTQELHHLPCKVQDFLILFPLWAGICANKKTIQMPSGSKGILDNSWMEKETVGLCLNAFNNREQS